jgi:hypothetical protein
MAQHLHLVLGEVADHQALAQAGRAGQRIDLAGDGLDQRGLAGAVDAQQTDALAVLQREVDAVHDDLVFIGARLLALDVIAGVDLFHHQQRVRRRQRLAEFEGEFGGGPQRRQFFHLGQRLHAALRLAALVALALKRSMKDCRWARLRCCSRSCPPSAPAGRALALEGAVVAGIALQLALVDMHDDVDHAIEEVAVVGNDEQGAG